MNKAILIVNVPEGYGEIADIKATVNLKNYRLDASFIVCNVPLKPIPQKKGKHGEINQYDTDIHYEIGWNDCLDTLIREE